MCRSPGEHRPPEPELRERRPAMRGKSVCGRPGFVTCCRTRHGATRCSIKRHASDCTSRPPASGTACVGTYASCCDACTTGGCATTTTTTSLPPWACSGGSAPSTCGGTCDPGFECRIFPEFAEAVSCGCFPTGATLCDDSQFPQCGGACPDGQACGALEVVDAGGVTKNCFCFDPGRRCEGDANNQCVSVGYCPPGSVCTVAMFRVPPQPGLPPPPGCPCCGCERPLD